MRIAVIGVGRLGGALARALGGHGHDVRVVSSRPVEVTARDVAGWPGVRAIAREEVAGSDAVLVAVPWAEAGAALEGLELRDHVVIDATNAFTADADPVDTGPDGSSAIVAAACPGARVVKAFNTLPAERYVEDGREVAATARRTGLPIASDDVAAADEVADLVGDLGFTGVRVGDLRTGARLMEPTSPLFNVPLPAGELRERIAQLEA